MELPAFLTSTRINTLFGIGIRQTWLDIWLWERFFTEYHLTFQHLVELGTGNGGFSKFLLAECIQHKVSFDTFDTGKLPLNSKLTQILNLFPHVHQLDVFKNSATIRLFLKPSCVLFCDNGNKPLEVETFSPMLLKGDYLVVHDLGVEVFISDIPLDYRRINYKIDDVDISPYTKTGFFIKEY